MADLGRKYTDSQIAYIERQLKKEYSDALKDLQQESRKTLERFEKWDAKQQARLKANEITLQDYTNWRKNYMLRSEQVNSLINEMSARMVHTDEIATDIINGRVPKVYAENINYSTYDIEKQGKVNTNFSLVSEDAVAGLVTGETPLFPLARVDKDIDWKWNEKHIRSALTQGILQGESIPKIAKRLQRVTDMDRRAATRNARTLMGRAQNAGRMAGIKRAKALGLPVKKVWIACLDNVTRDSHVDLDGEVQEYDHEFSNGLDYPCASGPPEETMNCRCDMRPIYDNENFDPSDLSNRNTDKLEQADYAEWKNKHKKDKSPKNGLVEPKRPRRDDYPNDDAFRQARANYRAEKDIYNAQKDELVKKWIDADRKVKDADDLIAWAESAGVQLEGNVETLVDKKLFNDITSTMDEMFAKYPAVKDYQDGFRKWSIRFTDDSSYLMEAHGGLNLGSAFKDAEYTYNDIIMGQSSGYLTRGSGDLASVIRHEYGHNTDHYIRSKFETLNSTYEWRESGKLERRFEAMRTYERELADLTLKHGSEYSRANIAEAFAEGFAEYTGNPKSEYGKAFGEFFERWYNASPIE